MEEIGYTLPPRYTAPSRTNGLVLLWRVAWIATLMPFVLWPLVIKWMSPEDTWDDCVSFALFVASRLCIGHLFFLMMFGVPFFCLAALKPSSWWWSWLVVPPLFTAAGAVAVMLTGYFMKRENWLTDAPEMLWYGIAYGLLTGIIAYLRRPSEPQVKEEET